MLNAKNLRHPRTGQPLRPVGYRKDGRPIFPILGGDGTGEGGTGGEGGAGGKGGSGSGETYKPPATQEEHDRIIEYRLSRERAKFHDYDALKDKAGKYDALENELASDKEKAVKAARDEERAKSDGEWSPRLVRAEFKAEAKGLLTPEQLAALLEDLDLSKYVTDKGEIDEEKVAKKVAAFAPASGNGSGKTTTQSRDLGQGQREGVKPEPGAAGRARAEKRFGKKSA